MSGTELRPRHIIEEMEEYFSLKRRAYHEHKKKLQSITDEEYAALPEDFQRRYNELAIKLNTREIKDAF